MSRSAFGILRGFVLAVSILQPAQRLMAEDVKPKPLTVGTQAGQEWSGNSLMMKFCWCPPGKFLMGSPQDELDRRPDEGQVSVALTTGYWLGKFEVTQGEWRRIMGATLFEQRDKAIADSTNKKPRKPAGEGDGFPIYFIQYAEASEFCAKLTAQEKQAGRLPAGWLYTLPTEAQWEYACRAGMSTATAMGNTLESTQANFDGNYPYNSTNRGEFKGRSVQVGSYTANAWGLCDMHGNVWEMCIDRYAHRLPGGSDPVTTETASNRVCRGGGWRWSGPECRSASRSTYGPTQRSSILGMRIVLLPPT